MDRAVVHFSIARPPVIIPPMNQPAATRSKPRTASRRLSLCLLMGGGLTLLVCVLQALGVLNTAENLLLDMRFRNFAFATPKPSDRILHIDIDNKSLTNVGGWPWPRAYLAEIVRELHASGAGLIAFDMLFLEPQKPEYNPVNPAEPLDNDALLARSLAQAGNVILPIKMDLATRQDPTLDSVVALLEQDITQEAKVLQTKLDMPADRFRLVESILSELRGKAARRTIEKLFAAAPPGKPPTLDESLRHLLRIDSSAQDPSYTYPQLASIIKQEFHSLDTLMRHKSRLPLHQPEIVPIAAGGVPLVPLLMFTDFISGNVSFDQTEYTLRSVPLWFSHEDRLWPHYSLAIACRYLRVPLDRVIITPETTILPGARMPDGSTRTITIPTLRKRAGDAWISDIGRMLISWQSNARQWENLYDPKSPTPAQHLSIGSIWDILTLRETLDSAHLSLEKLVDEHFTPIMLDKQDEYREIARDLKTPDLKPDRRAALLARRDAMRLEFYTALKTVLTESLAQPDRDADTIKEDARYAQLLSNYDHQSSQIVERKRIIDDLAARLRSQVQGRLCIIGWAASGAAADFVPTPLHSQCPGPVALGAIVNSILTDHFISRGPLWGDLLLTLAMGLVVTLLATLFSPLLAITCSAAIIVIGFIVNGYLLFDLSNILVSAAGPMASSVGALSLVIAYRLIIEQRERARVTARFKNYVSAKLVDYLADNPDLLNMEARQVELSCMFSDIAGFTTFSQRLGPEKTGKLLNQYLSVVSGRLMEHDAYINKFMGDGIMAFWGAPIHSQFHAMDACRGVLSVYKALDKLDTSALLPGMPPLVMRVGLATGPMMVGDFGAPNANRSDYTVIGDTVNLSARLEQANKQFDTRILLSSRTHELVREHMLCRPIGRIVVVGRNTPETVYELLADFADATKDHHKLAADTAAAVEAYFNADFPRVISLFTALIAAHGPSALADRYIAASRSHIQAATPAAEFPGTLVLTEK